MTITTLAALGGLGFVLLAVAVNVIYGRNGLPLPTAGGDLEQTCEAFAGELLSRPVDEGVSGLAHTQATAGRQAAHSGSRLRPRRPRSVRVSR